MLFYGCLFIPYHFYQETHESKTQASIHSDEMVPTPIHPSNSTETKQTVVHNLLCSDVLIP